MRAIESSSSKASMWKALELSFEAWKNPILSIKDEGGEETNNEPYAKQLMNSFKPQKTIQEP